MSYIYKTINLINNKVYVGQCSSDDKYYLGSGQNIKRAIKKYGREHFNKEILIEGKFTKDFLNELEKHYIRLYSPKESKLSYNLTDGGEGQLGWKPTKEQLSNMSKSAKNRMKDPNERYKAGNGNRGKKYKWSEERKTKISNLMKGNKFGYLNKGNPKKILQLNPDNSLFKEWSSITLAGKNSGISDSTIEVGLRTGKIAKGYFWKYKI